MLPVPGGRPAGPARRPDTGPDTTRRRVYADGHRPGPSPGQIPPRPPNPQPACGHSARRIGQGAAITVKQSLTLTEVASLPAVTDLVTAGQALGLGRTKSYELARAGQFPCPVVRTGKTWMVPTVGLLTLLGLPIPGATTA